MPAVDVATGNPGQVDKKAAAGRRRTKQEKALAELAFSNPGVKAAVGSRRSGTEPFSAPPPAQAPPRPRPSPGPGAPGAKHCTGLWHRNRPWRPAGGHIANAPSVV